MSDMSTVSATSEESPFELYWTQSPTTLGTQEGGECSTLINDTVLPTNMWPDQVEFEKLGIIFGDKQQDNPEMIRCILPMGWKKMNTNDPMIVILIDDKGRRRATIFRHPAYGCSDLMQLDCRIGIHVGHGLNDAVFAQVLDGERVLFSTKHIYPSGVEKLWEIKKSAQASAINWAEKYYPQWRDVQAYWEVDDLTTLIRD